MSLNKLKTDLGQPKFSEKYTKMSPDDYVKNIDEQGFLVDFEAASIAFATDQGTISSCAHAFPAFIQAVRSKDLKIDATLKAKPGLLAKLISAEKVKRVFNARESIHKALAHGQK